MFLIQFQTRDPLLFHFPKPFTDTGNIPKLILGRGKRVCSHPKEVIFHSEDLEKGNIILNLISWPY